MKGLLVFFGGGLGALIRYFLYLILPSSVYFPLGTLVANFFGCFIATIVFMYFMLKADMDNSAKTFLITGFCGGLSTLSALSLELLQFFRMGDYTRAIYYIIASTVVCSVAVLFGLVLVKHFN